MTMTSLDRTPLHLTVVTNNWHMDRTKKIFENVFSLPLQSESTCGLKQRLTCVHLSFESVEAGLSDDVKQSREKREVESLQQFLSQTANIKYKTFADMQKWIFTEHKAYASSRHSGASAFDEVLDEVTLKTY